MKRSLFVLLPLFIACAPAPSGQTDTSQGLAQQHADSETSSTAATPASTTKYEDAESYLADSGDEAGFTSWLQIRDTLASNFNDVCGDTFCEGDYSNLVPVRLRCSVDTSSKLLKSCKYVFAGSYEEVNTSTGSIKVTAKTFSCAIAVSGVPLAGFISTLTAAPATSEDRALQRKLPGSTKSIYDSLVGCL